MGGYDEGMSFEDYIRGKARRKPFKILSDNRCVPLDYASSETTGPISQAIIDSIIYNGLVNRPYGFCYVTNT